MMTQDSLALNLEHSKLSSHCISNQHCRRSVWNAVSFWRLYLYSSSSQKWLSWIVIVYLFCLWIESFLRQYLHFLRCTAWHDRFSKDPQGFKEQASSTRSRGVRKEARNNWPTFHSAAVVKLWPKATWGRVCLIVEFISELMKAIR